MKKKASILVMLGLVLLSLSLLLSSCGTTPVATPPPTEAPSSSPTDEPQIIPTEPPAVSDGQVLMEQRCSVCHSTSRVTSKRATLDEWTTIVDRMISKGAELNAAERQTLIDYLAQTYP